MAKYLETGTVVAARQTQEGVDERQHAANPGNHEKRPVVIIVDCKRSVEMRNKLSHGAPSYPPRCQAQRSGFRLLRGRFFDAWNRVT